MVKNIYIFSYGLTNVINQPIIPIVYNLHNSCNLHNSNNLFYSYSLHNLHNLYNIHNSYGKVNFKAYKKLIKILFYNFLSMYKNTN